MWAIWDGTVVTTGEWWQPGAKDSDGQYIVTTGFLDGDGRTWEGISSRGMGCDVWDTCTYSTVDESI